MFTVVVEGEGFGRESFNCDTLADALSAIVWLYHECQSSPRLT
jgi:hypothetical protein